jgi:hypothetical protein
MKHHSLPFILALSLFSSFSFAQEAKTQAKVESKYLRISGAGQIKTETFQDVDKTIYEVVTKEIITTVNKKNVNSLKFMRQAANSALLDISEESIPQVLLRDLENAFKLCPKANMSDFLISDDNRTIKVCELTIPGNGGKTTIWFNPELPFGVAKKEVLIDNGSIATETTTSVVSGF